jgi:hypothetical protein
MHQCFSVHYKCQTVQPMAWHKHWDVDPMKPESNQWYTNRTVIAPHSTFKLQQILVQGKQHNQALKSSKSDQHHTNLDQDQQPTSTLEYAYELNLPVQQAVTQVEMLSDLPLISSGIKRRRWGQCAIRRATFQVYVDLNCTGS